MSADAGKDEVAEAKEPEEVSVKKLDVKSLVAVIPPAEAVLRRPQKRTQEKRVRIRYGSVKGDQVGVSEALKQELGLGSQAQLVVAGRKRFVLNVVVLEGLPENVVVVNGDLMREHGIADNSIATLRSA